MSSTVGVRLLMKFNFYQKIRGSGWSEGLDLGYADLPTAIASQNAITSLLIARCACLGIGPYMVEAVLSAYVQPATPGDPPVRRSSLSITVPQAPAPGQAYNKSFNGASGGEFDADYASTVLYFKLQTNLSGSPVYSRNLWMAGLPDVADQTGSVDIVEANTLAAVDAYMLALSNKGTTLASKNSVSIRSVDRSGANPIKQCTAWNLAADSYTVPNHGFVTGQPILAIGCVPKVKGGSAPRGRYLVGGIPDNNTIYLQGSSAPSEPKKTGGFRYAKIVFNTVAAVQKLGFTKRDKGRPFGLALGRRRAPLTSRA